MERKGGFKAFLYDTPNRVMVLGGKEASPDKALEKCILLGTGLNIFKKETIINLAKKLEGKQIV